MSTPILYDSVSVNSKKIQRKPFDFHAKLTALNVPVSEDWLVYLYEKVTGNLISKVFTDSFGYFTFKNIEKTKDYFIIAFDKKRIYNSISYDLLYSNNENFKLLPHNVNKSIVDETTFYASSLVSQVVNSSNLLSHYSVTRGLVDDTGFSWSATSSSSTSYSYTDGLHSIYFKDTNYLYNRTKSFNNVGEVSTIEFWVKPFENSSDRAIVSSRLSDGDGHQYIGLTGTTNKILIKRPKGIFTDALALSHTSVSSIPNNEFSHVAVVFTGSTLIIYINGIIDSIVDDSQGLSFNINGIELGYGSFTGYLASFKLYSSVVYSAQFKPSKQLLLIDSKYKDPSDTYANNVLLKLGFPVYFKSHIVRDLAKNAFLTSNANETTAYSVTSSSLFETINESQNFTFRKKEFTFDFVFKVLQLQESSKCLFSNANIQTSTLSPGQWGLFGGTPTSPNSYVFKTFHKEYILNYNFILNEIVIFRITKQQNQFQFYINDIHVGSHEILESVGNAKDKFCYGSGSSLQIFDIRYTEAVRSIDDKLSTDSLSNDAFLALSYSYTLSQDTSKLGFGFTKNNAITTNEEFYSPDHSLVLDGQELISLPYAGDSLVVYDYTLAILITEVIEDNYIISLDKDAEKVVVSLTSDFKLKCVFKNVEYFSEQSLTSDVFNHITITFDKIVFKVYLNGVLQVQFNKSSTSVVASSVMIGKGLKGYLDDLVFYRSRVIHTENFEKPLPLNPEEFVLISDIQILSTTKYFLDFSKSIPSSNAYYDSKLNSNWNIYYTWIYLSPDNWLRFNYQGGVYYNPHSFYHNKDSFFSLSTRIRHILGPHNANGWTTLYYHPNNFTVYLNRVTGEIAFETYNSGSYVGLITVGCVPNILSYEEYDLTITIQTGKVWIHVNKELIGVANLQNNWTNTSSSWFGVGATGGGAYPVGYYDLKYFRYELNNTEFPLRNLEYLADKLAFKLNCSSAYNSTTNIPSLFDSSSQMTIWVNQNTVIPTSLIPFDNTSSLMFNGNSQYISCGTNEKLNVVALPFTLKMKVHVTSNKDHCLISSDALAKILILTNGSIKVVTSDGVEYFTKSSLIELYKPYSLIISRKKDLISIYLDGYVEDVIVIDSKDKFNFNEGSKTYIGSDLTNHFHGNLTSLSMYSGSSLSILEPRSNSPIFNYLSFVSFTDSGQVLDVNGKNTWLTTGSVVTTKDIKQYQTYSKTFLNSYYTAQDSSQWALELSDFTMEVTFRLTVMPSSSYACVFGNWQANTGFCLFIRPDGILDFRINTESLNTLSSCIKVNQWTTITIVRKDSFVRIYFNGVSVATGSTVTSLLSAVGPRLGCNRTNTDVFTGQIESFSLLDFADTIVPTNYNITKPTLTKSKFSNIQVQELSLTNKELVKSFYKKQPYTSGHLELKLNASLIFWSSSTSGSTFYFNKEKSLFEIFKCSLILTENKFSVSLQTGVEVEFTQSGFIVSNGLIQDEIVFTTLKKDLTRIVLKKEVTYLTIIINDQILYSKPVFDNLENYSQYLFMNSSSNSLTSLELKEFSVSNPYSSEVYLYAPLQKRSLEYVYENVVEHVDPVFTSDMLVVNNKILTINREVLQLSRYASHTLSCIIKLNKFNQDLFETSLYKVKVNNLGQLVISNNVSLILTTTESLTLGMFYRFSLEKYNSVYRLFINGNLTSISESLDESLPFTSIVIGQLSSDFTIKDLIFMKGSTEYEILLKESVRNDYNFVELKTEPLTSSHLTFNDSPTSDVTGRVWVSNGNSITTISNNPLGSALSINGTNDYLWTNPGIISGGSTPFSLEFLVNPDAVQPENGSSSGGASQTTGGGGLLSQNYNTGSGEQLLLWSRYSGQISYSIGSVRGGGDLSSLGTVNAAPRGHWTKVVLSYDGKTMRLFLNGRLEKSVSYPTGWINTGSKVRLSHGLVEGYDSYKMTFGGKFDEFRIIDGNCIYYKDYHKEDAHLISYLSFDDIPSSTSVFDNKGLTWAASGLTRTKDVVSSTTSYTSAYFNGSTTLRNLDTSLFNFETKNFSIKIKVYPLDSSVYMVLFSNGAASSSDLVAITIANNSVASMSPNSVYVYNKTGSLISSSNSVRYNSWNDIIIERNGDVLHVSLNGVVTSLSIPSTTTFNFSKDGSCIGSPNYTSNSNIRGYVDQFCIYREAVLIPSPKVPVLNLPLEHNVFDLDNYNTNWTFTDIEFKTYAGKKAAYFNGSTSYLRSNNANLDLGLEDFVITFECCATSFTNTYARIIATIKGSETQAKQYIMFTGSSYPTAANKQSFYFGRQDGDQHLFSTGFTATQNSWVNVIISRKSGIVTYFINGVESTSTTMNKSINFMENGSVVIGGGSSSEDIMSSQFFNGYLCNFKIYKGINKLL